MKKIIFSIFCIAISLSYVTLSASVGTEMFLNRSNTKTVTQGQYVYSGRVSYQGNNFASANGSKHGTGTVEIIEVVQNAPNKVVCSKTGTMGVSGNDVYCNGRANSNNRQLEARAKYKNVTGSSRLTVNIRD